MALNGIKLIVEGSGGLFSEKTVALTANSLLGADTSTQLSVFAVAANQFLA